VLEETEIFAGILKKEVVELMVWAEELAASRFDCEDGRVFWLVIDVLAAGVLMNDMLVVVALLGAASKPEFVEGDPGLEALDMKADWVPEVGTYDELRAAATEELCEMDDTVEFGAAKLLEV
jgi:hypothetical protein